MTKLRLVDQLVWMRSIAWLELAAGLLLSAFAFNYMSAQVAREVRANFIDHCETIEHTIAIRLGSYTDVLVGMRGFMSHSEMVTRAEFHQYAAGLDLPRRHPGLISVNFARELDGRAKQAFIQGVRRDTGVESQGYPDFDILPAGERDSYHVMDYVQPPRIPSPLMGTDLKAYSSSAAEVVAIARDTGGVAAGSREIPGAASHQWGLRLATYRNDAPTGTLRERRAALTGSVGLRFSLEGLLRSVLPEEDMRRTRLRLHTFSLQADPGVGYQPS